MAEESENRDRDIKLVDSEDCIAIVAEAWPVYHVALPSREAQYFRTRR